MAATHHGECKAQRVEQFSTTADLLEKFRQKADQDIGAVFHVAAVSDFMFGKIFERLASGELVEVKSGKVSTRAGTLMAELVPTPKIIAELRNIFQTARLVGWKFEVDGDRASVVRKAEKQIADCRTDACVANGGAYGAGFGLVTGAGRCAHLPSAASLFATLEKMIPA